MYLEIDPNKNQEEYFELRRWWKGKFKEGKLLIKAFLLVIAPFVWICDILIMIQLVQYEANEREKRQKRKHLEEKLKYFDLEIHETAFGTKKVWKLKPQKDN